MTPQKGYGKTGSSKYKTYSEHWNSIGLGYSYSNASYINSQGKAYGESTFKQVVIFGQISEKQSHFWLSIDQSP